MATNASTIATIKTQALARIESLTSSPKPNYTVDGQTFSWSQYLEQLQKTVEWCDKQLNSDDPIEVISQGLT